MLDAVRPRWVGVKPDGAGTALCQLASQEPHVDASPEPHSNTLRYAIAPGNPKPNAVRVKVKARLNTSSRSMDRFRFPDVARCTERIGAGSEGN